MSEPFLGEIRIFAGTFAPANWALCSGQLLSIAQNAALFSILGTTYGGDGQNTFQLPNLNGRSVLGFGQSTTGVNYIQGQAAGSENVTITTSNMPAHTHLMNVSSGTGTVSDPTGSIHAQINAGSPKSPNYLGAYAPSSGATGTMAAGAISATGSGTPISNQSPYLVVNYIIALYGIYPSRN